MNIFAITGISVLCIIVLYYILTTYNKLVNLNIDSDRQASHVLVHLKKKFDLIPALAEVVKGYAAHEKGTFEEVSRLRSQWGASKNNDDRIKTSNKLESVFSRLLLVQERYPKLKADKSFQNIMKSISYVERELVHERKVYNKRVSWYNVKIQEFPSNMIAKLFGFKQKDFFGKNESGVETAEEP